MRVFTLSRGKAVAVDRTLDMDAATSVRYFLTRRCCCGVGGGGGGGGWAFCLPRDESLSRWWWSLLPCEGMMGGGNRLGSFCMVVWGSSGIILANGGAPWSSRL